MAQIERVLFAVGLKGGIVLATDGATVAFDVREISDSIDDLGYCSLPRDTGLYLFEGTPTTSAYHIGDGHYEPETVWNGTVRPVKPEEFAALLAMTPPPEPNDFEP
jgi:hypothetical protein